MTVELDEALINGDADDIEKLLGDMNLDESLGILTGEESTVEPELEAENTGVSDDETHPAVVDTTVKTTGSGDADQTQNQDSNVKEIDGKLFVEVDPNNTEILGKDGKHTIPLQVLNTARSKASDLQQEVNQLKTQINDFESDKQRSALWENQLKEAGIDPDKLPNELLNDSQAIESLKNELPENAAKIIEALIQRTPTVQQPEVQTGPNEVEEALSSGDLAELNGWQSGDHDRWEMALVIDDKLKNDPSFQSMPIKERFDEVQRRVKSVFGDPVTASIEQEQVNDKKTDKPVSGEDQTQVAAVDRNVIPNSPSSLNGSATDTRADAHQALVAQDPSNLAASLDKMSPEAIEALLAEAVTAID